jgi:formylglycine-generating enzyme
VTSVRTLRTVLLLKVAGGLVLASGFAAVLWLDAKGLTVDEWAMELRGGAEPRFEWRSIDKKHWQAVAPSGGEPPEITDAREGNGAGCPSGMVRVKGNRRVGRQGEASAEIDRIHDAACTDWISRDFPARCRTYDKEKIAAEVGKLPVKPMDYCVDRFEYPNVAGENPMIVVSFREAETLCKQSQKRLCTETEWTFACEGEEVRPYPYGWERDATACVIDRAWRPFVEGALSPRDGDKARLEVDRLWQGEPSGTRAGCKSPFGVYDLTGNVDEWTRSARTTGYPSILKGGYWGPVRARCRPATRAHGEDFVAYQQSFRCCSEANASIEAPAATQARSSEAGPPLDPRDIAVASKPASDVDPSFFAGGPDEEADELDALARARSRYGCAAHAAGELPGGARSAAGALVVALSLLVRRRSRVRA